MWVMAISCFESVIMCDAFENKSLALLWLKNSGHLDVVDKSLFSEYNTSNEYSCYPHGVNGGKHIRLAYRTLKREVENG